jgi:hypothetical protein
MMGTDMFPADGWLGAMSPETIAAIGGGAAFILLNLYTRFNDLAGEEVPEPFRSFKLAQLTSPRRFRSGLLTYCLLLVLVYVALLRLGPALVEKTLQVAVPAETFPLYLALCLAGVIPNVPGLARAEVGLRTLAQRVAGVPPDLRYVDRKINMARIEAKKRQELLDSLAKRIPVARMGEIIDGTDQEELLKCYLIVGALNRDNRYSRTVQLVTQRARRNFKSMLDDAQRQLDSIEENILEALKQPQTVRKAYQRQIRTQSHAAYRLLTYLLSCAIVAETSANSQTVLTILKSIGFNIISQVRRYLAERVLAATIAAAIAVLVTSAAVNVLLGLSLTGSMADVAPLPRWFAFAFSFAVLIAVMIGTYTWRRDYLIAGERWYMTANSFRPRISAQLGAGLIAVGCTALFVPFLDAAALFIEAGEIKSWNHHFPMENGAYANFLLPYLATPVMVLVIFAKLIERDRRIEFDPGFANEFFSPRKVFAMSAGSAVVVALLYVMLTLMLAEQLRGELAGAWAEGGIGQTLGQPEAAAVAWFLLAVGAGVYVFFRALIRSGQDVGENSDAPAVGPGQAFRA